MMWIAPDNTDTPTSHVVKAPEKPVFAIYMNSILLESVSFSSFLANVVFWGGWRLKYFSAVKSTGNPFLSLPCSPSPMALSVSCSCVKEGPLTPCEWCWSSIQVSALFFGTRWTEEGGTFGKHLNSAVIKLPVDMLWTDIQCDLFLAPAMKSCWMPKACGRISISSQHKKLPLSWTVALGGQDMEVITEKGKSSWGQEPSAHSKCPRQCWCSWTRGSCGVGWENWGAVWDFTGYEGGKEREGGGVYECSHLCRGYVQGNSRHLEDEWDMEGNPVCCLAALHCSGKAKQL